MRVSPVRKEHWGTRHAPKSHECKKCRKTFGVESQRIRHEARCGIRLSCACGKIFATSEGLAKHIKKSGHRASETQDSKNTAHSSAGRADQSAAAAVGRRVGEGGLLAPAGGPARGPPQLQPRTPRGLQVEAGAQTLCLGDEFEAGISLISLAPSGAAAFASSHDLVTSTRERAAAACQTPFEWAGDDALGVNPLAHFDDALIPVEGWAQTDFSWAVGFSIESATQTHPTDGLN
jgi:hypothetical protein